MRDVTTRELTPAVTVLQLFLSSSKPVLRFAAVRTLNKVRAGGRGAGSTEEGAAAVPAPGPARDGQVVGQQLAMHPACLPPTSPASPTLFHRPARPHPHPSCQVAMSHPMAVTNCNIDMESLIADPNRSIATLVRCGGGGCRWRSQTRTGLTSCAPGAWVHALPLWCARTLPDSRLPCLYPPPPTPPHPHPPPPHTHTTPTPHPHPTPTRRPSPRCSRPATSRPSTACSSRLAAS